ncbi:hypothetical protein TeGR_g11046 [Tetraparma gracilis]|uniref:Uncharacterized protein n=1 Tax=Tetraparma gracilis TaxID=2962635 RepID=A0ABQ6MNM1_9STRA|nr:hypothetical protein TeGR_g11046 [Tetraparma gracilis]
MSEAVVYTGAEPTEFNENGICIGEWERVEEVTNVTIADGVTEIKEAAFYSCIGLTNLSFLKGSAVTTVGVQAFRESGIVTLQGMERVRKIGDEAFAYCKDLRTIEGLGCEEMGDNCFARCTLLQSMKGWPASMTVIPKGTFWGCTSMTTVDCDISHVTSIGVSPAGDHAFAGCTSLLPPSLSKKDADPAAVLAYLKEMASNERDAARAAELEIENAARAAELLIADQAARAAEDSLLAELDAEDAAKKGKKKKKKKKKASSKKGKGEEQAEPDDWRSDFQRYVQSDMMRGVEQRKRQRNLEEAARVMAAHEQKIAALHLPPSLAPPPAAPPPAPLAPKETTEDIEAQIAALGLDLAPLPAPDELTETAEDIEAQIAALGLPPNYSPVPAPAAAPDAFLESLIASSPPAAHQSHGEFLEETVAELHTLAFGAEEPLPPDNYESMLALLGKLPPDTARDIAELARRSLQR